MTTTKHFIDQDGNYIGGFAHGAQPPENSIEVFAPEHGWQKYDLINKSWLPLTTEQLQILGRI